MMKGKRPLTVLLYLLPLSILILCPATTFAFTAEIWNPPIVPVQTTGNVHQLIFEVLIGNATLPSLPSSLLNISITGNAGSVFAVRDTFWAGVKNDPGPGNHVVIAGEALQQSVRYFNGQNQQQQRSELTTTTDFLVIFVALYVDPHAPGPTKGVIPSSLTIDGHFTGGSFSFSTSVASANDVIVLERPVLSNAPWIATNGLANLFSAHRRAITPTTPLYMIQRYAIDWLSYGDDNKLYRGDGANVEDWYCYGEDLVAVRDGTVVATRDDLPDGEPFVGATIPITGETVLGNHVILDFGNNNGYAMYAHMKPGSVVVEVGEEVKAGQVVGKLGNSGNSGAPHLHLHVSTCPTVIDCADRAYVFEKYRLLSSLQFHPLDIAGGVYNGHASRTPTYYNSLMANLEIIQFNSGVQLVAGHVFAGMLVCVGWVLMG